jgi:hypothetical protein
LSYNDKNYKNPNIEEWEGAKKMCVTSNLCSMQVALIEMEVNGNSNG